MELQEYAKQSKLSLSTLKWMTRIKVIHDSLTEKDLIGLEMVEKIWANAEAMRRQLRKFSTDRRFQMVENCEFETKWEQYAFARFQKAGNGGRISMKEVINDIERYLDITLNPFDRKKLYSVREKVYNRRRYRKNRPNGKGG